MRVPRSAYTPGLKTKMPLRRFVRLLHPGAAEVLGNRDRAATHTTRQAARRRGGWTSGRRHCWRCCGLRRRTRARCSDWTTPSVCAPRWASWNWASRRALHACGSRPTAFSQHAHASRRACTGLRAWLCSNTSDGICCHATQCLPHRFQACACGEVLATDQFQRSELCHCPMQKLVSKSAEWCDAVKMQCWLTVRLARQSFILPVLTAQA